MNTTLRTLHATLALAALFTACGGPELESNEDLAATPAEDVAAADDALTGAAGCTTLVGAHFTWMGATPGNYVRFRLVSHQSSGRVVVNDGVFDRKTLPSLSAGCLTGIGTCTRTPAVMSGGSSNGGQLFSDRGFTRVVAPFSYYQPFDATRADAATVTLDDRGTITVVKGGVTVVISNVECLSGSFYGVGSDGAVYSVTLTDEYLG